MSKLPNFTALGEGFYVCRTQAGYKQAVKHFIDYDGESDVWGHPESYPSVVSLSHGTGIVKANCLHINNFREGLDKADPQ